MGLMGVHQQIREKFIMRNARSDWAAYRDQLTNLVISRKPDEYGSVHLRWDFNRAEGIVYDMLIRICSRKGACSIG